MSTWMHSSTVVCQFFFRKVADERNHHSPCCFLAFLKSRSPFDAFAIALQNVNMTKLATVAISSSSSIDRSTWKSRVFMFPCLNWWHICAFVHVIDNGPPTESLNSLKIDDFAQRTTAEQRYEMTSGGNNNDIRNFMDQWNVFLKRIQSRSSHQTGCVAHL